MTVSVNFLDETRAL